MEFERRETGANARKPESIDLTLDSLETVRADLANVTAAYMNGEVGDTAFRAFVYATNALTKLLVHGKVSDLEKRIKALEKGAKT